MEDINETSAEDSEATEATAHQDSEAVEDSGERVEDPEITD